MDNTAYNNLILWKHGSHPDIGYCAGSQAFADDVLEIMKERKQLEAENARIREELACTKDILEQTRVELSAAQLDAARYRWLREHPCYMGWEHDFRPDEVDTAVDKEMKEQP